MQLLYTTQGANIKQICEVNYTFQYKFLVSSVADFFYLEPDIKRDFWLDW